MSKGKCSTMFGNRYPWWILFLTFFYPSYVCFLKTFEYFCLSCKYKRIKKSNDKNISIDPPLVLPCFNLSQFKPFHSQCVMDNQDHCALIMTFYWSKYFENFASNHHEVPTRAQSIMITHDSLRPWNSLYNRVDYVFSLPMHFLLSVPNW